MSAYCQDLLHRVLAARADHHPHYRGRGRHQLHQPRRRQHPALQKVIGGPQIFFARRVKYFSPPADRCPRSRRTTRAPTSSSRTAWCRARGRGRGRGRSRPPTPRSSRATRRRWPRRQPTATSRTPSSVGSYWGGTIFWEQLAIGKSKNKSHKLVRISSLYPSYYLQFTFTIYIQHLLSHLVVSIHKLFYTIVV